MESKQKRKRYIQMIGTLLGFILFLLIIWLYGGSVEKTPLQSQDNMTFEKAEVTEILSATEADGKSENSSVSGNVSGMAGNQDVKVKILSGAHAGKIVEATNMNGYLYGANCKIGTPVIVQLSTYGDNLEASVYGYNREIPLYILTGIFILVLCITGGRRGIFSAIALIFTFVCLIGLYLPMLYRGWNPLVATILSASIISVVSLLLIGGYTKKTLCAVLGTMAGVAISGCVAMIFGKIAHISGYNTEDVESMIYVAQNSRLQIGDLLYAGILIASLGAVMDVAMSISSTIQEIHEKNPQLSTRELFKSGIHVGRDMMGTMSNTLILAFAGTSLNTMILIYSYSYPYTQIINMYSIGIEILRGVSGTIGIILTVPFISLIAPVLLRSKGEKAKYPRSRSQNQNHFYHPRR